MRMSDKIKWMTMKAILKDMEEDREDCIHVSDIVYECARRGYYSIMRRRLLAKNDLSIFDKTLDEEQIITFWVGKKLHETPISTDEIEGIPGHEFPLELEFTRNGKKYRVVGRADEIMKVDGEWVLIDKKTARKSVSQPYSHHVEQVMMYSAMLKKQYGLNINRGAIIYINVADKSIDVKDFPIPDKKKEILERIIDRTMVIQDAIDSGVPPPPCPSWLCRYCEYFQICVESGW